MKTTLLRTLACLLAALTLVFCFAACDSGESATLCFTANGTDIAVGASSDAIIAKLGTPLSETSSESCGGFEGKDYVYTYKGYRVSTTPAEDGQIICKVELTDDSVKTPEGLYIGMASADAEAAMKGFNTVSLGENRVYTAGEVKLQVVFRDGAVSGIIYVAK